MALYAIISVSILFPLYYSSVKHRILAHFLLSLKTGPSQTESLQFVSEKLTGILFTGIIPSFLFIVIFKTMPSDAGFKTGMISHVKYPLIIILMLISIVTYFSSKNPKIQEMSPELRTKTWQFCHVALSSLSWLIYLFGYEFFFRGILWFLCYNVFGFWWFLSINIILYSLVHMPKGKIMTLGAIPLGILLCIFSYISGSFFPAFLIHYTMAVSTELFSVYHNPEFHFHLNN